MQTATSEITTAGNENQTDWWQRDDLAFIDNELHFAGHRVQDLAEQFGTPVFVYSLARAKANLERLHNALCDAGFSDKGLKDNGSNANYRILYAMKANRFGPLLTSLKLSGLCGIDACSPQEVELAVSCGFSPADISFTAGSLSQEDYRVLNRYRDLNINCDSLHAIKTWGELRPGGSIGIRVNPGLGVSREGNERLQYAGQAITKFGIYQEQFHEALTLAKQFNLTISRIHFHTGCGYLTEQIPQLDQVVSRCMWFVEQCDSIERVNIGGGLGVPHDAADGRLDVNAWARMLFKHFKNKPFKLDVEPGEYVMKDAGLLLLSKTYLEKKADTLFLGVDAGFNLAPEPAFYDLRFQPLPLSRPAGQQTAEKVTVVGNINEALDVFYRDALMPDMRDARYLTLINAGAYSTSMASNHCARGQHREYLLT